MNFKDVDEANRQLDNDFRLDDMEDDEERQEAKEAVDRKIEYNRIVFFLFNYMTITETAGIVSRIMHHWSTERDSYYQDELGRESLFYRGFEITEREGHWMCEWEDNQTFNFWDANLMTALNAIDDIIKSGVLK